MKCPACDHEPVGSLLESPCPVCKNGWMDTYEYTYMLTRNIPVETVLDVGCGNKGVIAQHYWESVRKIKQGYACDRFKIKSLPPIWTPLVEDAENLPALIPGGVDVITHCGLLEHIEYEKAFRVLRAMELTAKKLIFFSCSTELREVDYKVKADGNPYHYYRSWWDGKTLEALGYHIDRKRMAAKETFHREAMGYLIPSELTTPWEQRLAQAKECIAGRRCCVPGCNAEPLVWTVEEGDSCYCCVHYVEKYKGDARDVRWWLDQPKIDELLAPCIPPWRKEKLISRSLSYVPQVVRADDAPAPMFKWQGEKRGLNGFFDKVFCINLDSRPDRWKECQQIFSKYNIVAERFPAIHMTNCTEACTYSHLALFKRIAQGPWEKVLILEDDFHILTIADIIAGGFKPYDAVSKVFMSLTGSFEAKFNRMVEFLPSDWDLFYLGAGYGAPPIARVNQHVIRCASMMTTSSYGITKACATGIFKEIEKVEYKSVGAPDIMLGSFSRRFRFYVFQPRLMIQRQGKSDLTGRTDNYLFSMTDPTHESMV